MRRGLTALVVLALLVIGGPWVVVRLVSAGRLATSPDDVPAHDVVLVLGAAVWANGPSPYLQARLDLAAALYRSGRAKVIIVSGTQDQGYNEPDAMRAALVAAGVPPERIVPDYAGFDTYSSCQRARDVFGVTSLIVVSQAYHTPRAVASCRLLGMDAVGAGDDSRAHDGKWLRYSLREIPGDTKLLWDVLTHRDTSDGQTSTAVRDALAAG